MTLENRSSFVGEIVSSAVWSVVFMIVGAVVLALGRV